jgi:hypothetical protein
MIPIIPFFSRKMQTHTSQVIIKWRGKPVFIRHRTDEEIAEAENTKWEALRDPQPDSDRVQKPDWLIMLGMLRSSPFLAPTWIRSEPSLCPNALAIFLSLHFFI